MKFEVTSSPHIRSKKNTQHIMLDVILALLPALLVGVVRFGVQALLLTLVSVAAAVAAEWICGMVIYHRNTVKDLSTVVTGLLLAMTLPSTVPYWVAAFGSAFAIILVKGFGGGLGKNVFNPALAARALLMLIWPIYLVRFPKVGTTGSAVDMVAGATPLHHMQMPALPEESLMDMFLGNIGGCIGEVCTLALLAGAAYLVWKGILSVRIPAAYLGTVAVLTLVFSKGDDAFAWMLYSLLGGGVMLGAFFMATQSSESMRVTQGELTYSKPILRAVPCRPLTSQ